MTPRTKRNTQRLIALALLTSFAVSGCGIRGGLKTPPPIWGKVIPVPVDAKADKTATPNTAISDTTTSNTTTPVPTPTTNP